MFPSSLPQMENHAQEGCPLEQGGFSNIVMGLQACITSSAVIER